MQKLLLAQESSVDSKFQFHYKRDFELYQGVRGDWVHAWHLWPRGFPNLSMWLRIASDKSVDLFKLREVIYSERERVGIDWDLPSKSWQFRIGLEEDGEP